MAGDKKVTEMTELVTATANTWVEVIDLDEANPDLQNKKMKQSNVSLDAKSHDQNTDQYIDAGGLYEVAAADIHGSFIRQHWKDEDTYLDKGQANEVTAANAKLAVDKMHNVNEDTILDDGGANEITAFTLNIVANRMITWAWIVGNETLTGQMSIGADVAGKRSVYLNKTAVSGIDMELLLESLAINRFLSFSFPSGHYIGEIASTPSDQTTHILITTDTRSEVGSWSGYGILTIT